MNRNEFIADSIEEIIGRMFTYFRPLDSGATEYSMFYNPRRHAGWFIVIFFADKRRLKESLRNGACYQIYNYLRSEFDKVPGISNIERSISFEAGNRPDEKEEIYNVIENLISRQEALRKVADKKNVKKCSNCNHDFDAHQLLCNLSDTNATPTDGWIMCPEEDCNCFLTWGSNFNPTT